MKAKDLMIGNLVTDEYYDSFKQTIKIESIHEDGVNVFATDDNEPYGLHSAILESEYEYNKLRPIPLTEEWLVKFGFVKCKVDEEYFLGDFIIYLPSFFKWKDSTLNKVKHVYQLQNLYKALTGEELEIKTN